MSWKESARGGLLSSLKHSQQTQCVLGMSERERQRVKFHTPFTLRWIDMKICPHYCFKIRNQENRGEKTLNMFALVGFKYTFSV